MKLKTKFIIIIIIIVFISLMSLSIVVNRYVSQIIENQEESYHNLLKQSVESEMQNQLDSARMSVNTISENPEIQRLFAERNREALTEQLLPVYELLQDEVAQIQFHLPDSTSFLRLHMPDRYGDSLKDFRFTVNQANQEKVLVEGLEEGRGGYGFRVVVPMFYDGVHTGSVEYGSDFSENFLNSLKDEFGGEYFIFTFSEESVAFEDRSNDEFLAGTLELNSWKANQEHIELAEKGNFVRFNSVDENHSILLLPFTDYQGDVVGYIQLVVERGDILALNKSMQIYLYSISFIIAIFISIFLIILLNNLVLKKLSKLQSIMKKAESGDFTVRCENNSKDEIGELTQYFNKMIKTMSEMIKEIKSASSSVANSSKLLKENSNKSAGTSEEVSMAVEEIAKGASDQSIRTEDGTQKSIELGKTIEENQELAMSLYSANSKVSDGIEKGLKNIEDLMIIFEKTENAIDKVHKGIELTNNSSEKISEYSQIISGIADQTNLLALNAAIEAARAGETGKGFAVVAEEIRKLAEGSGESTKEIDKVIVELKENSQSAVKTIKDSFEALSKLEKEIKNSQNLYNEIQTATLDSKNKMENLTESTRNMIDVKNQILDSLQELAAIAEENSASTEEVSASVEEQTDSIKVINNSSKDLLDLAESLKYMVEKFKVN